MSTPQKKTRFNRLYIVIVILLVIIAAGIAGWNMYKYKFISNKVKSAVFEKTKGLYTIHYDNLTLDEVGGYLHVTNIRVVPDTAKFRQMVADGNNPPMVMSLEVPELEIAGVKTPEAMLNKKLTGRRLEVNDATVIFYYAKGHRDSSKNGEKEEMYQQLLGSLKEIQADTVEVKNVSFAFIDIRNGRKTIEASNVSVHLRDVLIDSLHSDDTARFFFSKHIDITAQKTVVKNKANTYHYLFDGVRFNRDADVLSIQSLQIAPQLSEAQFAAYSKLQNDRFNFSFKNISLKHLDLQRVMETDVVADSLVIKQCTMHVFRDLSYPHDTISRVGTFPQQLLMRLPINLSLHKLIVGDAFIEYKEKNPKSEYSGRVQFTHANAVISNITNEPDRIKANRNCVLDFNARFLDMAPLHAHINLILKDPKGRFTFNGSMQGFDAPNLNVLTEPMGLAKIEKGKINNVAFNFSAYNYGADGKLTLLYDDLKVTILKKDQDENKFKKKKLLSFIANILVKNSNPSHNKPPRVADVHYQRDINRSFFNLMWKSIYAGVKQSAGL